MNPQTDQPHLMGWADAARAHLHQQQDALLRTLMHKDLTLALAPTVFCERDEALRLGLAAYRNNASANTHHALALIFPTVRALIDQRNFADLAQELLSKYPPQYGDLSQWGVDLGPYLAQHPRWQAWPYLADCAQLDLAIHRSEMALDATLDASSLHLLNTTPPTMLRLILHPSMRLVQSSWPIVTIHQAHQRQADEPDFNASLLAQAQAAIQAQQGECAAVVCHNFQARITPITTLDYHWMQALRTGMSMALALEQMDQLAHRARAEPPQHVSPPFDLSAWLIMALQQGWVWRAEALTRASQTHPCPA